MSASSPKIELKPSDYKSGLKPVWCPGCGDFGVLNSLYRAMANLQIEPWNTVLLSGIGCSSRLPGYVKTYGFNGVHGRALTLATGVKMARPELTVIVVGGDGDGLAIGGNHMIHACRRNLDVTYILMDNEIYGLTKGQVAPTTPTGDRTKSTFWGNPEPSVDPCELAISTGATWVGRGFSGDVKGTTELITAALRHKGFSFLNVMSPCVTWRGDGEAKRLKAMHQRLPEDHDRSHRENAIKYTREQTVMTTGILYQVQTSGVLDEVENIRVAAMDGKSPISAREMLSEFFPAV
jgi:2-oxoglutarate ferredoxin oxidoreductase subunit beta